MISITNLYFLFGLSIFLAFIVIKVFVDPKCCKIGWHDMQLNSKPPFVGVCSRCKTIRDYETHKCPECSKEWACGGRKLCIYDHAYEAPCSEHATEDY